MRLLSMIGTAALALTLAVPAYGQQDQQESKDKPAKSEEKHPQQEQKKTQPDQRQPQPEKQRAQQQMQQEKPASRDQQNARDAKPAQQNQHQAEQPNQHPQQQDQHQAEQQSQHQAQQSNQPPQQQQHAQQQRANEPPQRTPEQQHVQQSAMQQHRSHSWDSDHRNWKQRGGYNGYRIPDDRFRGYFGQDHGFRISGLPFLVVGGYPRFQYGGYWFSMVDPWPESWGDDWYDNDDVYVVYFDNGYYLYNHRYPNVGIAVNISM